MPRIKILVLILVFLVNLSWAPFNIRINKVSRWEVCVSNFGKFAVTRGDYPGAWWSRNTGHNYINGAGIWIGTIAPNGDTLVTIGFIPTGAAAEFGPGIPYSNPMEPQWRVYFSSDVDYPLKTISWEDGFTVFNDFNPSWHVPNDTRPIGVTVTFKTYAFAKYWGKDVLFIKYIIKNDTNYTMNQLRTGISMNYDIGNEQGANANDRGGIDLQRKLFYGWQETIEPGWGARPGMIGLQLLSPYPLACFKRFTRSLEPSPDRGRYMAMAGYNYQNGNYEPFDTIWFPPDDNRILMCVSPFNLPPGDSIILDWALLAAHDSMPPSPELEYKADKAQALFNTGFHNLRIIQPNGGEVASGNYQILYSAASITPNPLLLDFFLVSEHGYDTIALSQSNTGNYTWNTTLFPDGVLNKIIGVCYDTITFGGDNSDGYFVINNPGNAPPYLKVIKPTRHSLTRVDTLRRDFIITWFAKDPEFLDSLYINIYFKSQYDSDFQPLALNEPNDSHFVWKTLPFRNGSGILVVETRDEEFVVSETINVYISNQISGGPLNPIQGVNNILDLFCSIHQPEFITGHTYRLEFLRHQRIKTGHFRNFPEYIYRITDLNTGIVVLDTYSLKESYYYHYGVQLNNFSPITDGFSIRAYTIRGDLIKPGNFRNDSVKVVMGNYPEDSIALWPPLDSTWWAYRGSRLQLDWIIKPGGGLTLAVTDLDYGDTIPYKSYGPLHNPDSAFGWCFRPSSLSAPSSDTLRHGYDKFIFLCGGRIRMNAMGIYPQVGERWIVYPSRYSPPVKGNIYQFTPVNYVGAVKSQPQLINLQVFPMPFKNYLTIVYALSEEKKINLAIYDVLGRRIRNLKDGIARPSSYKVLWDGIDEQGRRVGAGVYFCKLETDDFKQVRKVVLVK